jgi:hypothetical protein
MPLTCCFSTLCAPDFGARHMFDDVHVASQDCLHLISGQNKQNTCSTKDAMHIWTNCCVVQVDLHYNGFCNSVLWQLFHYIPLNLESKLSDTRTLNFQWKAHQEANRKFAEVISQILHSSEVLQQKSVRVCMLDSKDETEENIPDNGSVIMVPTT